MSINKQNTHVRKKEITQSLAEDIVNILIGSLSGMDGVRKLISTVILALEEKDKPLGKRLDYLSNLIKKDFSPNSSLDKAPIFLEWYELVKTYRREEALFRMSVIMLTAAIYDYFIGSVFDSLYNHFPRWGNKVKRQLEEKNSFKNLSIDEKEAKIADKARNDFTMSSRIDQLRYLDKKLSLNIEANYSRLNYFIEVSARRNLYVHTGGVISKKYEDICRRNNIDFGLEEHEKVTGVLFSNNEYIDNAIDCFYEISFLIAHEIVIQAHHENYEYLYKVFADGIFQAIKEERWNLAESLCHYLLKTSQNLSSEVIDIIMTYLCLVMKIKGEKFETELGKISKDKANHLVQHLEEKALETFKEERWQVAEYLYEFILHFQDLIRYQGNRNILKIYLCIAKKFGGKPFMDIIKSCAWSKEGKEYEFAVTILEDNYYEAIQFMNDEYIQSKIGETEYLIGPLFRDFRESKEFLVAYKEIMGKEFASTSS